MPLYEYKCDACDFDDSEIRDVDDRNLPKICSKCGCEMRRVYSFSGGIDVFPADGIFLEHVSPDGKRFFSKQEMKDYEKKHDMTIGMLH